MRSILKYVIILFSLCQISFIGYIQTQGQPYLGQTPPTNNVIKFKPSGYLANSAWWWASSPTFSPDGNEMYFSKYLPAKDSHEIWFTKYQNGVWQSPQKVTFTKTDDDSKPTFVVSNDTLYYKSRYYDGGPIYKVTRTSSGWSEPVRLNLPIPKDMRIIGFTIAKSGNIYLCLMDSESPNFQENYKKADIFVCYRNNGVYSEPVNLGAAINSSEGDGITYIDPDERFMFISSLRTGGLGYHDLYISVKNKSGTWGQASPLSAAINSPQEDSHAKITPDGKYFFFITEKYGDAGYRAPIGLKQNLFTTC